MFVLLVGAERIERPNTHDAHDPAEDISLFKVEIDQFFGLFFNIIDSASEMRDRQARRPRHGTIEAISGKSQAGTFLVRSRIRLDLF